MELDCVSKRETQAGISKYVKFSSRRRAWWGAEEKVQHVLGDADTGHHTGIRAMRHWTATGEFSGL